MSEVVTCINSNVRQHGHQKVIDTLIDLAFVESQ